MLEEEYEKTRRRLPAHLRRVEAERPFSYEIRPVRASDIPDIREIYNHYVANTVVTLDEESIGRGNPDQEHERAIAIFDILEDNSFTVPGREGPYALTLGLVDRLAHLEGEDLGVLSGVLLEDVGGLGEDGDAVLHRGVPPGGEGGVGLGDRGVDLRLRGGLEGLDDLAGVRVRGLVSHDSLP